MHQWMKLIGLCLLLISGMARSAEVFVTYYHNDLLGSPVAATDEWGNILWREHFRPYGERQGTPAYRGYGSVGFTGHVQSQSSELVYMGARYYDPVIGRFLSVDPAKGSPASPTTINRYAYANLNPYKYTDPTGRFGELTAIGCGISAAAGCALGAVAGFAADVVLWSGAAIVAYQFGKNLNEAVESDDGKTLDDKNSFPDRDLPRDKNGRPVADPEAEGAYTQLGRKSGRKDRYNQGREFDSNGAPIKDIDFTDHGRPGEHENPHQHPYVPNSTGGTPQHGRAEPLKR